MTYHIKIELQDNDFECSVNLNKDKLLNEYIKPYLSKDSIMINGRKIKLSEIYRIKIVESNDSIKQLVEKIKIQDSHDNDPYSILKPSAEWRAIDKLNDVTDKFLKSSVIFNLSQKNELIFPIKNKVNYVNKQRINELGNNKNPDYDFVKLIQLCKEINVAWQIGNYYSVIALLRTILHHIPPIFGFKDFAQVTSNYAGGKSFKKSMQNLFNSSKNIADNHLHSQIKKKDTLPNNTQVDYKNDLDLLLSEIIRLTN